MTAKHPPGGGFPFDFSSHQALAQFRHALRSHLTAMMGYSEMLLEEAEESTPESVILDLRRINSAAGQLLAVVNEGLDPERVGTTGVDSQQLLHDLRTPLNAIIGYSELLQEEGQIPRGEHAATGLENICAAARDFLTLVEQNLSQ